MKRMSNAPYASQDASFGNRMGYKRVVDLMIHDGLSCSFTDVHMGEYGDSTANEFSLSREEQDRWALRSHERALKAIADGKFAEEIIPVEVPQRRGEPIDDTDDEGPRADTNEEKLAKLRPAFTRDGTTTAGNAPGVNDGACAFVMMSEEKAAELNKEPLAIIHGQATV